MNPSEPVPARDLLTLLRQSIIRIGLLLYIGVTLPVSSLSLLMALVAETGGGRWFAIAGLLAWLAIPLAVMGYLRGRWRRGLLSALASLALAGGAIALCGSWAPRVEALPSSGPSSWFRGGPPYSRWTPASLVPEIDQFKLGSFLMPLVDPHIDFAESQRLRAHFLDVYRGMGADPRFARLPSVMSHAYGDAFLGSSQPDHLFVYLPEKLLSGKRPVLLFLHGSCGNFQAYLWVLKELADREGIAIVAPSYGFGEWAREDRPGRPGGLTRLRQALSTLDEIPGLDRSRVDLVGLSNGGLGVTRAGIHLASAFRKLVYISPVLEPGLVGDPSFLKQWKGRQVRIIHGDADNRIPLPIIQDGVQAMKAGGVDVQLETFAKEEHWLFFSKRHEIVKLLTRYLARD